MGEKEGGFGVADEECGAVLEEVAGDALGGEEGIVGFLQEDIEGRDPIRAVRGEDEADCGVVRKRGEALDEIFEECDLGFGIQAELGFLDVQGEETGGEAAEFEFGLFGGDLAADKVVDDFVDVVVANVFLEVVVVGEPVCADGNGRGGTLARGGTCELRSQEATRLRVSDRKANFMKGPIALLGEKVVFMLGKATVHEASSPN